MKGLWVLVVALVFSACVPDYAERGNAPVILRITKIIGSTVGGGGSGIGDVLNSDVCCTVVNDNATVSFEVFYKNRNPTLETGKANDVFLDQYEVRYFRTDGRNTEGVDVPYRITGGMGTIVAVGIVTTASLVVVRHQAKLEPPLKNLANPEELSLQGAFGGGAIFLTVMAEITVRGHTTAGQAVEAKGLLQINFADFVEA